VWHNVNWGYTCLINLERISKDMTVRVGFIGTGGIATSHLLNLASIEDAEVVALCDIAPNRVEEAREYVNRNILTRSEAEGVEPRLIEAATYTDYRQMIRNERLDAVYICLPPFAHGDPEHAALDANLHMLVEKPVALDLRVANDILRRVNEQGVIATAGYQLRYMGFIDKAIELLRNTVIGQAIVLRFTRTPGTSWYHRQDRSGGMMIEMATHQVDLLRFLVGEIRKVYAAAATRINNLDNPEYDIFDVNSSTFTFDNGAVCSFAINFLTGPSGLPDLRGVHIFCKDYILSMDISLKVRRGDDVEEFGLEHDPMLEEDKAFIEAVKTSNPAILRSDYLSAVRTLAVTIANDRSARSGMPVDVSDLLRAEAPQAAW